MKPLTLGSTFYWMVQVHRPFNQGSGCDWGLLSLGDQVVQEQHMVVEIDTRRESTLAVR